MNASARLCTPGRIAGLALIVIVALGLGYLRLSGGSERVSVPSGAHAGTLTLHPCHYATERGSYSADCGTLVVPENRHDAHSHLIALPVTRIRAHTQHPGAPVFRLQGGPGISNMSFPDASRFTDAHDVVLVGYRGVDGSSRLDSPEVASSRAHSPDFLSAESLQSDASAFRACADRLRGDGIDLAGYSIVERVDDLELARRALGYRRIDLVSESAGTRTAMIYSWRHPKSIHRSVMIAVNPPGHFLWDAKTTGDQIRRYAALCEADATCRSRTPDLAAAVKDSFERIPGHFWFLPIKKGNVKVASFFGLMNATSDGGGPIASPLTIDTLLSADEGDGAGTWFLSLMAQLVFPRAQVWGDVAAIGRSDAAAGRRFFASGGDRGSLIGAPGTDFIWAGGRLLDAWPANPDENEYTRVRDSKVATLLIGGNLDFATPPQNAARELLPHLENGRQVVLPNVGHADDFWTYQPTASSRLINTYLDSGRVDTSLYTRRTVDFEVGFSQGRIATIVLISLLALASATAISLLWLPARVLRRRQFGRKASVAVRSLYALVLGIGGWAVAALVALTAFPTVPLDDVVLVVTAVCLPAALAVLAGWLKRDSSSTLRLAGLWTAVGAAMLGGWLGYHAPATPLLGVLTAAIGAIAAANLGLIALDVAGVDERAAAAAPAAVPSPGH